MSQGRLINVLLLESDNDFIRKITEALSSNNCKVRVTRNSDQFLAALNHAEPDVMLLDMVLKNSPLSGFEVVQSMMNDYRGTYRLITFSKTGKLPMIHEVYKLGDYYAYDKGHYYDLNQLTALVVNSYLDKKLETENLAVQLDTAILKKNLLINHPFIGESQCINLIRQKLIKQAKADSDLFIIGETGTGKEVAAYFYFTNSDRFTNSFEIVNCSALSETLIESELFGHVKGSFTDADRTKTGMFERCNEGVLFLDEITNLSLGSQSKLLRAIENKEIQVVGGEAKKVNTKLIFASNAGLDKLSRPDVIRRDLFFRIESNIIELPPLRERGEDILLLLRYFLTRYMQHNHKIDFTAVESCREELMSYQWPGNVREIKNFCKAILIEEIAVDANILGRYMRKKIEQNPPVKTASPNKYMHINNIKDSVASFEYDYISYQLEKNDGNISKTASQIGVERTTLYKKMKNYGMKVLKTR